MIIRLTISNFKNFGTERIIELGGFSDNYHFTVVIGRNGAGKSAVIDAIEWCLFGMKGSMLRVKNTRQLVNSKAKSEMYVIVELRHPHLGYNYI